MSVDLSRVTGDPSKHYSRVVFEQGRPHLDADLNEQQELSEYRSSTEAVDVIGGWGAPKIGGGFHVTLLNSQVGPDVAISAGRMYASGVLAELTPAWLDVKVVANNQVAVPHRIVDGLKWQTQPQQYVEVGPQHQILRVTQLTDVAGADLVLTLSDPVQGVSVNDVVRLRRQTTLGLQPDLPTGTLATSAGRYRVYLDVWEQQITWIQDAFIREIALGGVDHAGRAKVRAQVRLERIGPAGNGTFGPQDCQNAFPDGWRPQGSDPNGTLRARVDPGSANTGPCVLPPTAGFQGLENQLYRVQVHHGGDASIDQPTFKWQRDNGSVATAIEKRSNDIATVHDTGRDDTLGFKTLDTVEASDDTSDLSDTPFTLQSVLNVFTATRQIQLSTPYPAVDPDLHAKLQRWDGTGNIAPAGQWVTLEQGLQVEFAPGLYRPGDYWMIPARTATGSDSGIIEWPIDDTGAPLAQPPSGVKHQYAPVGLADFDGTNFVGVVDCRPLFPPLTDITAGDVKFDDSTCQLPGVTTVQQAIDALCDRTGSVCTLTARPGPGWESIFAQLQQNEDARICFPVGTYPLASAVVIADKGNLLLEGSGLGTRIASQGEAALVFQRCSSVRVRDMSVTSGTVGAVRASPTGHLNGALTFRDCPDVVVERVLAATPAATIEGASCLTLAFPTVAASSARIHSCDLLPGHMQVGALVVDCDQVSIEDCVVRAGAGLQPTDVLLQDAAFRRSVRSTLLTGGFIGKTAKAKALTEQAAVGGGVQRVLARGLLHGVATDINVGNIGVTLRAPGALASAWQGVVQAQQAQVGSPKQLLKFVQGVADRLLIDSQFRILNPVFNSWIQDILRGLAPSASAGIVIAGTKASNVRILNNSVINAIRGVHLGFSGGEGRAAPRVSSGPVLISGNTIDVRLSADATRGRHGIFVGNSDSLIIENCRLTLTRATTNTSPIDGIRIWGVLGRMMVVRQNHVVGFSVGARVVPVAPLPATPLWRVADNVLAGGLLAPSSVAQTSPAPGTPLNIS
jgi:hypothetical protein